MGIETIGATSLTVAIALISDNENLKAKIEVTQEWMHDSDAVKGPSCKKDSVAATISSPPVKILAASFIK